MGKRMNVGTMVRSSKVKVELSWICKRVMSHFDWIIDNRWKLRQRKDANEIHKNLMRCG
jgi:hypothetical protein